MTTAPTAPTETLIELGTGDVLTCDTASGEILSRKPAAGTILGGIPAVEAPDPAKLLRSASMALQLAQLMPITNQAEYDLVSSELQDVLKAQDALEAKRLTVAGPLHKAWTAFNAMFKTPKEMLEETVKIYKAKMLAYLTEQERLRAEAAARAKADAQAIIDKANREAAAEATKAAAETARLDKEAQDAKAVADAATAAAAAATAAGNVEAAAAATAQAAAATELAAAATEAADQIATVQVIEATVRESVAAGSYQAAMQSVAIPVAVMSKGTSRRSTWVVTTTDKAKALAHIAAHPELHALVDFNQSQLNALAKAQQTGFNLPGMEAKEEGSLAVRRRAA